MAIQGMNINLSRFWSEVNLKTPSEMISDFVARSRQAGVEAIANRVELGNASLASMEGGGAVYGEVARSNYFREESKNTNIGLGIIPTSVPAVTVTVGQGDLGFNVDFTV